LSIANPFLSSLPPFLQRSMALPPGENRRGRQAPPLDPRYFTSSFTWRRSSVVPSLTAKVASAIL
jgi:hypothetical protein